MELLSEKYQADMHGVLSCYDRIVIAGHLQPLCYAKGMTKYLYSKEIRIFDYTDFAQPLRDLVRENAATLAQAHGLAIEFVTKSGQLRKEERIRQILQLTALISACMEQHIVAIMNCRNY